MRQNPSFTLQDPEELKRLIRENPWGTLVSATSGGIVASHYPVILDEDSEQLAVLTHVGRPDDLLHELGEHEVLLIIQGPHGYVSPGWYDADPAVPTWNFLVAHLYGIPEILEPEENHRVLGRLVDVFEEALPEPRRMEGTPGDAAYAQRISSGTVGLRLTPTRVIARAKLSQNKPGHVVDRIIENLEGDGPYSQRALAAEMRRAHDRLRQARNG